ncbi:MAG: N-acetylmuramoyl-L-alanine amidase, partial [Clostridia bacterium]|nr:N-acetylmuramoyl-L-alanine amidase [Clostridia bacterium]
MSIKKKTIIAVLCVLLCAVMVVVYFTAIRPTFKPALTHTIVIDAGHGGKDGGAVGRTTGITESELNLQYSLTLKSICEQYGFNVVLTRSDMNGLYSPFASNKKRSEMEKRKEIIDKTNPDLVISIHMNSFTSSSAKGVQVFYADGCESGQALAESVQTSLYKTT